MDIKTPELPESVDEATLLTWHVNDGQTVSRDEKLADVETDKIVLEVFAPAEGVIRQYVKEGDTLKRGDKLATILEGGALEAVPPAREVQTVPEAKIPSERSEPVVEAAEGESGPDKQDLLGLSPAVRKMMNEHNVHPAQIVGSGKDNRITRQDVIRFIEETPVAKKNIGLGTPERVLDLKVAVKAAPVKAVEDDPTTRRVPMSQLRIRVAARLKEVQNTAALLTTFNEINMKPVMDIRSKYKDRFEKEYGVKLGFMSFFVKAAVEALKKHPVLNASVDGKDILYHECYHVGIAVDSPRGLVVPVLRNAENMNFADVEKSIRELAQKAKDAKLAYEDLIGGTFTITNGGVFGSMLSTPIINAPQSAILGMHSIQDRPWVEDGQVVVRPIMYLALTYDHRIIDGRDAVQFLISMKNSLEDPAQLMLQL